MSQRLPTKQFDICDKALWKHLVKEISGFENNIFNLISFLVNYAIFNLHFVMFVLIEIK